ncbi:glycerate kinase [Aureibaculum sp. A20]|uniref:Glycerate kinase n=1 Tax=Aureibaculum flavum TaxID=2795986 RepID=A0ABS0WX13_9FLAO|nr:glycerate kinase [Aureibaculum flavum]MBJ2176510.1 glycerate kinase [Aureibaculum flavum]
MKIVIAPDKFKGSLTGLEFCDAVASGIQHINPEYTIVKLPLADGGDGTIDVANYYLDGTFITTHVNNPLFKEVEAQYLYASTTKTAFIEMAEASGLKLLKPEELDCKNTSTYGTGQLILDALKKGATKIILGIGGSATNDCGTGMAAALGFRFLDANKKEVLAVGKNLSKIKSIDASQVNATLKNVTFKIACDVTNPLYGIEGAAYVYGTQKGASTEDIKMLDQGLKDFSNVLNSHFNTDVQQIQGGGAAGGMGVGTQLFLNGALTSGIDLVKEIADFETQVKNADWIITGEGKLDDQTLSGKTINGVLTSALDQHIKVAAFCGAIELPEYSLKKMGIEYAASVIEVAKDLEDAMQNSSSYLITIAENFIKEIEK